MHKVYMKHQGHIGWYRKHIVTYREHPRRHKETYWKYAGGHRKHAEWDAYVYMHISYIYICIPARICRNVETIQNK